MSFVVCALVALLLGEGGAAPAGDDWLGLDRELAGALGTHATLGKRKPSGLGDRNALRFDLQFQVVGSATSGEVFEVGGQDRLGVSLRLVRLGLRGQLGDFHYRVSTQGRTGALRLSTARVRWRP